MTTKPAFPGRGAPMSPAWVHGSPHVEELALPKSLKSCNFTLAKAVIRWMSVRAKGQPRRNHCACGCNAIDDAELRPCTRGASSGSRDEFHRAQTEKRQTEKKMKQKELECLDKAIYPTPA